VIVESVFTFIPLLAMILFFTDLGMMLYRWSTCQKRRARRLPYAAPSYTGGKQDSASVEQVSASGYAFGQ